MDTALYTPTQAAERLNCSRAWVVRECRDTLALPLVAGQYYLLTPGQIEILRPLLRPVGHPCRKIEKAAKKQPLPQARRRKKPQLSK